MRKIIYGVVILIAIFFIYKYFDNKNDDKIVLQESSALIQEQINNVGKLIVTEGHFSEVFNYRNSKEIFGSFFTSEKKALIVVNADVFVSYDLSLIEYKIDESTKTLTILSIPEAEIKINPDLEYYDIQADYFNAFEAKDYNDIKETVKKSLVKKLENSEIKSNAKNRLISELSKFYILTNSLGWTLKYNETTISSQDKLGVFKL
ncbi:DUF4230 domain-containing protein [Mariniflexile aquimaris]|uniref:DUF4230 domain-containing protein n=1 Tax=Mariniflexile aquimaris TaxID=881009 RepID=A0ABW3BQE1_9FLAO